MNDVSDELFVVLFKPPYPIALSQPLFEDAKGLAVEI